MDYLIRELKESEYPVLEEFLYQAIFQRDEKNPIPRSELTKPSINIYIRAYAQKSIIKLLGQFGLETFKDLGRSMIRPLNSQSHFIRTIVGRVSVQR